MTTVFSEEIILPKITSAFFILTESCNLACRYCFVKQNPEHMSYQTAVDATKFLIANAEIENKVPSINFFGGEPLLKWDEIIVPLTEYIRKVYQKRFNLSMTTNGILLDEEKLKFMKENKIGILFSIDGAKKTQDNNRPLHNGESSFDMLKNKIPLILKYNPDVTFRATIAEDTAKYTFDNIKFAVEQGFNNMFFIPNTFYEWDNNNKKILKEQMRLYSNYFIDNCRNNKIIHLNNLNEMFNKIIKINNNCSKNTGRCLPDIPGQGRCGLSAGCAAAVGTDGILYGCQELSSYKDSNIFIIGDIYSRADNQRRLNLANRFDIKKVSNVSKTCESCKLNTICDGGCAANNYLINGDINMLSDMYCYWLQILLDEAIYICNVLGNEKNELFKKTFFTTRQTRCRRVR